MLDFFLIADILGLIAFTISGFLIGVRNKLDILGVAISASLTALGGGVIRDTILGVTPSAFTDTKMSIIVLSVILIMFFVKFSFSEKIESLKIFLISDSIGLVSFSITGALLAIEHEYNFFGIVILSFITAVGGGLTRDILINKVPLVLISDFYGSISILVSISLIICEYFDYINIFSLSIVALCALLLRVLAFTFKWYLPSIKS